MSSARNKASDEIAFTNSFCAQGDVNNGVRASIDGKWKDLEAVHFGVNNERYFERAQAIRDYGASWDLMERRLNVACRQLALCSYRTRGPKDCVQQQNSYDATVHEANQLLSGLKQLDVTSTTSSR